MGCVSTEIATAASCSADNQRLNEKTPLSSCGASGVLSARFNASSKRSASAQRGRRTYISGCAGLCGRAGPRLSRGACGFWLPCGRLPPPPPPWKGRGAELRSSNRRCDGPRSPSKRDGALVDGPLLDGPRGPAPRSLKWGRGAGPALFDGPREAPPLFDGPSKRRGAGPRFCGRGPRSLN